MNDEQWLKDRRELSIKDFAEKYAHEDPQENAYASAIDEIAAIEAERDELHARCEAMRALLTDARRYVDKAWPDGVHSYRANSVSGDLLSKIDAALQEPGEGK